MVVEPVLERLEIGLGRSHPRDASLLRDVRVDPLGGVSRLVEGDDPDRHEERSHGRHEHRVDDAEREAAREPDAREVADERVEREGDHRCGQEEDEDVPERAREQEGQHEHHREDDELDPPRRLDRRAALGHARDRTGGR